MIVVIYNFGALTPVSIFGIDEEPTDSNNICREKNHEQTQ